MSDQLETICLSNLDKMLSDKSWDAPTITGRTLFQERIDDMRSRLHELDKVLARGTSKVSTAEIGSAFLSFVLPSLFEVAAEAEGYSEIECRTEKNIIGELLRDWCDYYRSNLWLANRYFSRQLFSQLDVTGPSLEIGTADGVNTALTFKKKLTVGSNPSLPEFLQGLFPSCGQAAVS